MFYLRKQHTYRQEETGEGAGGSAGEEQVEQTSGDSPEEKEKATKMGWVDKPDFKGDPDKWRPAKEFLDRGESMLPIVKATVKKQERQIADLEKTIKEFAEYHSKTEQRAYQKAFNELKEKQIQAVAAGDAQAFVKVDAEITELQKEASQAPKIKERQQEDDPVFTEWSARNKWLEDKTLEKEAEAQAIYLRERGDNRTGAEFLDAVKERVKKEFPDKFENPRRQSAQSVESGAPAQKKGGKSYADMPADARAACDRMAKNVYASDAKAQAEFKTQYVKQYFDGE